ncbi:hypothetical protein [Salsuginibacillus kocurii]|uniref:hypothetical protein n=1 Tax=Salsuginibacillus kocurii TaxID=427078 RepID=UPI0003607CD3|nr:hypothetical protein [Salsuginibacillus kocurii]
MDYSELFVFSLIAGVLLSFLVKPKLADKSMTEILYFSMLLIISGFGLVFLDVNVVFTVFGLTLFVIGFLTGTVSFLFNQ